MDPKAALIHVAASLKEGAELRLKVSEDCGPAIVSAALVIEECLRAGGKLLFCGNGGSAADSQHLVAEFVGRFMLERRALPAIALTANTSILTAIGNDYSFDQVFARQVEAFGRPGDVVVGISTSGNSPNVIAAMKQATELGLKTIGLTGRDGGALAKCVDIPLLVPSTSTARIQECHLAIGHVICELVETSLFAQP